MIRIVELLMTFKFTASTLCTCCGIVTRASPEPSHRDGLYCRIFIDWNFIVMGHNYCINIVINTSEFHLFDNPIVMSYIASYLLYWYCESHIGILWVRQAHHDELYSSVFIVLILWELHENFICSTPWLHCIIYSLYWYCESHVRILCVRQPHPDELYSSIFIYWYCEHYNRILFIWHPGYICFINIVRHNFLFICSTTHHDGLQWISGCWSRLRRECWNPDDVGCAKRTKWTRLRVRKVSCRKIAG